MAFRFHFLTAYYFIWPSLNVLQSPLVRSRYLNSRWGKYVRLWGCSCPSLRHLVTKSTLIFTNIKSTLGASCYWKQQWGPTTPFGWSSGLIWWGFTQIAVICPEPSAMLSLLVFDFQLHCLLPTQGLKEEMTRGCCSSIRADERILCSVFAGPFQPLEISTGEALTHWPFLEWSVGRPRVVLTRFGLVWWMTVHSLDRQRCFFHSSFTDTRSEAFLYLLGFLFCSFSFLPKDTLETELSPSLYSMEIESFTLRIITFLSMKAAILSFHTPK